ncbi:MAG: hypothetical protein WD042_19385 [Phycisphaeraceae bacterium]
MPNHLASPPIDPITGHEARYLIIDGKPIVYSVGIDHADDRGRVPTVSHSGKPSPSPWLAATWTPPTDAIDGDWRLFPLPHSHLESGVEATRYQAEQEEHQRGEPSPPTDAARGGQ